MNLSVQVPQIKKMWVKHISPDEVCFISDDSKKTLETLISQGDPLFNLEIPTFKFNFKKGWEMTDIKVTFYEMDNLKLVTFNQIEGELNKFIKDEHFRFLDIKEIIRENFIFKDVNTSEDSNSNNSFNVWFDKLEQEIINKFIEACKHNDVGTFWVFNNVDIQGMHPRDTIKKNKIVERSVDEIPKIKVGIFGNEKLTEKFCDELVRVFNTRELSKQYDVWTAIENFLRTPQLPYGKTALGKNSQYFLEKAIKYLLPTKLVTLYCVKPEMQEISKGDSFDFIIELNERKKDRVHKYQFPAFEFIIKEEEIEEGIRNEKVNGCYAFIVNKVKNWVEAYTKTFDKAPDTLELSNLTLSPEEDY